MQMPRDATLTASHSSTEKKLSMIEEVTEHATTASGQQSMAAILLQHHNHNTSHGSSGHGSSSYAMTPSRAARSPLSQQRASARPSPPPALAAIPPAHMFPSSMYSSGTTVRESRRSQRDGGGGLVARAATPTRRDAGSPPSSAAAPPSAAMPPLLDTPYMRLFQPDVGSWDEGRTPTRRPRSRSPELTFGDLAVDESGSNSVAERPTASASQQQRQQRNSASSATSSDPRHKSSSRDRPAPPDAPQSTSLSHSHQASRFGSRSALPRSLSIFAPASQQQQQKQEQPTLDDDVVIVGLTTADLGPLPDPEDHPHGPQDPLGVMAPSYEDIRVSAADYSSTDDSTGRIDSLHHQAEEEEEEDRSGAAMDETMSSGVSTLHHGRDAARQPLPLDQGGTPRNGTPPSSPRAISGLSSPEPSPVATPVRPSQPPVASSDPQTPAAQLTMTAVKRHIEARLAAEETPMPLHDALLSLENVSFFGDKDDQRAGAGESPPAPAPWSLRSESPPPPLNFGERLAMLMRATHGDRSPLALPPTSHSTAANTNVVHSGASEPSLSSLHSSTVGRSLTPTPTKPTPATAKSTAFAGRRSSPPPMITPLQDPPYVMPPDTPASAGPRSHDAPPTTSSPPHDEPVHGQLAQALLALMGGRPVWSTLAHVAELDLSGFDLDTLEGLDKCAPHLSWLRCVRSRLRYLEGTPTTVTHLAVADNRLSTLTSLHHLAGLQELDISGNHVDDLIGCAHLPHLRVLKADRNGIASWAAVPGMRALQVLHLRGNRIASLGGDEEVHGGAAMWPALVELDLTGNQVETVSDSLDVAMPKLRTLVLDANGLLGTFLGRHARVQSLSLADNLVTQVADVATHWPSLRRINLDGNQVRSLDLSDLDSVDHVQLACQSHLLPPTRSSLFASSTDKDTESNDDDSFDYSTLQTAARLSLRNNPRLPPLDRMTHMYQLVHLDLAGCGIRALPTRMARHVPALRRLDLSQNCLSDLAPVAKMRRLRWLSLRSNDVGDFFQAVGYLGHLTRLEVLDLRQNPLTALFYPNLVMSPPGVSSHHPHPVDVNEDDDEKAAWAVADQQYQEQQLNDSTLVKRACYRTAVLYHLRASLRELDWIAITADQRAGAPARYARMERSLAQVMARSGPRAGSAATWCDHSGPGT
ncbi:hypothetical protein BC828DRAFT_295844 [Blastocladiella britannica]|nr:hypothetical protein BC828DRAFT_295844 [Blastocladiella britannica]